MRQTLSLTVAVVVSLVFGSHVDLRAQQAPGMPTNVAATQNGNNLAVAWGTPMTGAAPTAYRLDFHSGSTLVASLTVASMNSAIIPIPPGTQGTFTVTVTALTGSVPGPPAPPATFTLGGGACSAPPATPTGLTGSFTNGTLSVQFNPVPGATNYIAGVGSTQGASNVFNGSIGNITSASASGLPPGFQAWLRISSQNACGISAPTSDIFLSDTLPPPLPTPTVCIPSSTTVCAFNRFQITVNYRDSAGRSGPATVRNSYFDGAEFYFVDNDTDLLVQIVNRCSSNNRYWVFASGLTNAEAQITVTDTANGSTRQYTNPLGRPFAPINDTSAFATCP
jgi:hypothetical protein